MSLEVAGTLFGTLIFFAVGYVFHFRATYGVWPKVRNPFYIGDE